MTIEIVRHVKEGKEVEVRKVEKEKEVLVVTETEKGEVEKENTVEAGVVAEKEKDLTEETNVIRGDVVEVVLAAMKVHDLLVMIENVST